jgi:hypothetical protein
MSKLDKFIQQHRHQMDAAPTPPAVWEKVAATLPQKKKGRVIAVSTLYKWAAAAIITGAIATGAYFYFQKSSTEVPVATAPEKQDTNTPQNIYQAGDFRDIAPEYSQQADAMINTINSQQKKLEVEASTAPELYKQFAADISTLDSSYRVLEAQAMQTPNRDVIIKAMLQNLQLKAELLSRQLMITNQFKNSKNKKNETGNKAGDI